MAADPADIVHDQILDQHDKVLIVDFGSQVTQLIARRVREAGVYCEIAPFQSAEAAFAALAPKAVILSGGPASVTQEGSPRAPQAIFEAGVPVLGICYGEQLMAVQLGGAVEAGHHAEYGRAEVEASADSPLFAGVWERGSHQVWMSHGDRVTELPPGFSSIGHSPNAPVCVIADEARKLYGLQFHPEVHHTPEGPQLLCNFLFEIAHCSRDWTMKAFRAEAIAAIRAKVGQGDKGGRVLLAQGTLYPDVIESVSFSGGPSVTIKSHHNVGGLPERMNMKLVEPLRELFKDEVRALGRELGLPEAFVGRHPFPGPGLAIRCPGAITPEKLAILRRADAIYLDEIRTAGLYDTIWQAFAVLLPVQTVGVMGDGRTYDFVCALRAVTSVDGMTADFYPFDMNVLGRTATRIINEVKGINRVVYDVTSKPPGTIEWE